MSSVIDLAAVRAAKEAEEAGDLELVCNCGAELFIVRLTPAGVTLTCPECDQDMTGALSAARD